MQQQCLRVVIATIGMTFVCCLRADPIEQKVDSPRPNAYYDAHAQEKHARRASHQPPRIIRDPAAQRPLIQQYTGRCTVLCGCGGTELVRDCLSAGTGMPVLGYFAAMASWVKKTIVG